MVACATANTQTNTCDLGPGYINPRCIGAARRLQAKIGRETDNTLLECRNEAADAETGAIKIDERVNHQLTRTVIGHLTTTIDLHDLNIARRKQMIAACIEAQCKYGPVLREPDLVRSRLRPGIGQVLHRVPDRFVVLQSELTNCD